MKIDTDSERRLKKQLDRNWLALSRIINTAIKIGKVIKARFRKQDTTNYLMVAKLQISLGSLELISLDVGILRWRRY